MNYVLASSIVATEMSGASNTVTAGFGIGI